MAWIESHQSLAKHPKTRRLARELGVSIPTAIGHLHLLWWWALDYAEEGDLSKFTGEEIAEACLWEGQPPKLKAALGASGFVNGDGTIHDWNDYAGRLLERRRANAQRMRDTRAKLVPIQEPSSNHETPRETPETYGQVLLKLYTPAEMDALKVAFPGANLDNEATKCCEWWIGEDRQMKRPKVAFRNWMDKWLEKNPNAGANSGTSQKGAEQYRDAESRAAGRR